MPGKEPLVHAVGDHLKARVEHHPDPSLIDHVWISMQAGEIGQVQVSINTSSRRNLLAGFDPRVRVGVLKGSWKSLPQPGFKNCPRFDYGRFENSSNIYFEHFEREEIEKMLLATTSRACLLEAWGAPYEHRKKPGLHQIHSRRASCAVPEDIRHRDGALQFYFAEEKSTALFLFKFCGQP